MSPNATVLFRRLTTRTKLKHIEVLVRLSQYGSMGRAAESLGMSQPAVSQIVSELEKIFETELFLRHARGIEPTTALRDILPMAQRILLATAESAESVAARLEAQDGPVRVYATPAAINGLLIHALPTFAELHPNIQILIAEEPTPDSTTRIAANECDILALRQPAVVPESWLFEPIMDDALIVICHRQHPLARSGSATLEELSQSRWLMNRLGSISRNRFEEVSEAAGWPNSIRRYVITHVPALTLQMLSEGRDLALVPKSLATPWLESGEIVEIRCDVSTSLAPLGFLWQGPRTRRAARHFANHLLKQTFKRNDSP